ncbi:MAG: cytochrome-c oxidase [Spirochaetales bacterium]|jgi:cytochrome c oxidase subunit 4|nr:cytochrome-c oxidase [Spirochaetales bacterium]|tara:strand:- start:2938 stop:3219 length:282 start_codon:yes stop_codon:yes gene_type:complete
MASSKVYRQYLNIWVLLMVLTILTVGAAQFDFGGLNVPIALIIASIKAGVVALYFMHLKHEDNMTWVFVIFPLFLLALFIGFSAGDVFTRLLN